MEKNNFDCCKEIHNIIKNTESEIGLVIVWDKSYNNKIIEEIQNNNLKLIYSQELQTTLQFTENLLREIHMEKLWWIKNMKEQSNKRFNNSLIFHIFQGLNMHKIFRKIKII